VGTTGAIFVPQWDAGVLVNGITANARWQRVLTTGKTVPWDKAQAYLEARARGEQPRKPSARKP
jgi:hypothetical protein